MSTFRRLLHTVLSLSLLATFLAWPQAVPPVQAAGTYTGTVYQDYNGNGVRDLTTTAANDGGVGTYASAVDGPVTSPVTVTAYDAAGNSVSTTTASNGTYSLSTASLGAGPYRLEFTNLPTGFQPGPFGSQNGTTVRVVPNGGATGIDLGLNRPEQYCQNNPQIVTNCYAFGDQITGPHNALATIESFPYSAGSTTLTGIDTPNTHATTLRANQVGTTWGLAWATTTRRLYASAFFKNHAGYGPGADGVVNTADDPGAIYVIDPATNAVVNVFTVPNTTINGHDTSNYVTDGFDAGWDATGKASLGGMDLSDDESTLYVMNLENRSLYALNAATGAVIASQPVPLNPPLDAPAPATCPSSDVRPFAVHVYRGQLYVGLTCTGESSPNADSYTDTNANGRYDPQPLPGFPSGEPFVDGDGNGIYTLKGDTRWLQAYVYTATASLNFGPSPAFRMRLDYPRGLVETGNYGFVEWQPWVGGYNGTVGSNTDLLMYPQPWLTDLDFDGNDLILGLRDRLGDIASANGREDPTPGSIELITLSAGDVLRACANGSGWTLESAGQCGGNGALLNNGQGPGGGEFYRHDYYLPYHDELGVGAVLQVPGFPDVIASVFDPPFFQLSNPTPGAGTFDGGARWLANTSGTFSKAYRLFNGNANTHPTEARFGKAASLGDMVVLCDAAPIEVGNLVWLDVDKDGVQDPDEAPIANVTVRLYAPNGTLLATATTDANGQYYFSSAAGTSTSNAVYGIAGLTPNTSGFTIRLDDPTDYAGGGELNGLSPTLLDSDPVPGLSATRDIRDSDGQVVGGFPRTTFNTGGPGANNHTYDFGFTTNPTAATLLYFRLDRLAGGGVALNWATAAEVDVAGYRIYRASAQVFGQAQYIHYTPAARAPGGSTYAFTDTPPGSGPWWYWLEELSTSGTPTLHPPVTTASGSLIQPFTLFLTMVRR
ncbi:MAG: hypothetical protein JNK29_04300 [Anaerolineales bacterium]|nr:hypothetical protein [Anaerolineales bacterium]